MTAEEIKNQAAQKEIEIDAEIATEQAEYLKKCLQILSKNGREAKMKIAKKFLKTQTIEILQNEGFKCEEKGTTITILV